MTIQDVRALIDAKIKGQGTNVDAGSVLPAILNGILDLIAAGGGGTSDAVQYIPQELTAPQQMQARKNLDLYYETPEETNTVHGSDEGEVYGGTLKLISSDTPNPEDIRGLFLNEASLEFSIIEAYLPNFYTVNYLAGFYNPFLIILQESSEGTYANWPKGIYIRTTGLPSDSDNYSLEYAIKAEEVSKIPPKYLPESDAVQYVPQELTEAQKMQARKNQGLYYEGTEIEELEYDPNGQQVSGGPAFSEQYFIKASDTPIALDDLGTVMAVLQWDEEKEIEITPDKFFDESARGWYCVFQNGEQTGMPIVTVILEDSASPFGVTLTKGVWFYLSGNNHTLWVEYSATTVHQIPAKYIPDIPIPSGGIETVELLSIPTNYANSVAESTFFSADDLAKVKSSDVCIAEYSASPARKFLVVNDAGTLTFYGKDGIEFTLIPYNIAGYFTVYPVNGGSIILSGLPTASMTSAELEALGFGPYGLNISAGKQMRAKNVVIVDQYGTERVLGIIVLMDTYLEFWDATNKYVVANTGFALACTVTPRT